MSLPRQSFLSLLHCLLVFIATVVANTEKIIFSAPDAIELPQYGPSLAQLRIDTLSPASPQLRLFSPVIFANTSHPKGLSSWYILQNLNAGGRYEVRVCWPATQPTTWDLEVYTLSEAFDTPALIQDLARFANEHAHLQDSPDYAEQDAFIQSPQSLLFLRTWAAADYFTLKKEMMRSPPVVHIDLILDPYLLNAVPRSLLATAGYILCVALVGWTVSSRVWTWLETRTIVSKTHVD
ncbi:hypothetical protein K461DRAFT_291050 [Myriangium duriaei CBS 260.36]|uniref:Uncharacterized protein n=1 Tax=Myriangium duriaei CBS 260.36 TaxID=1168546 RepID=A0A9P4J649_9PEZI|nr:hypothetical protein K461DRAFT_291050 [Myriangium duriaei CBS 260.36]